MNARLELGVGFKTTRLFPPLVNLRFEQRRLVLVETSFTVLNIVFGSSIAATTTTTTGGSFFGRRRRRRHGANDELTTTLPKGFG